MDSIAREIEQILRDLNPWWEPPHPVRPAPPPYRRRGVSAILQDLLRPRALIHVLRGPRQVGKTTALYQLVEDLLQGGVEARDILLVRFDLPPIREAGDRQALWDGLLRGTIDCVATDHAPHEDPAEDPA